jgi:signal peptidase I
MTSPSGSAPEEPAAPSAAEDAPPTAPTTASTESSADGAKHGKRGRKQRPLSQELPVLLVVAILLALLLKAFVVQAFFIPSGSMERTLLIQDRVLVNKVVYRFRDIHRGEIVVFNGGGTGFTQSESVIPPPTNAVGKGVRSVQRVLGLGAPGERDFVKRVIGVGGDTVACCDDQGRVTVNGVALDEPYVFENNPLDAGRTFAPFKVPDGQLWVMGDHRGDSGDSRINGPIPTDRVIGRAFVRVWPLNRLGALPVPKTFAVDRKASAGLLGLVAVPALIGPISLSVPLRRRRRS